jgi:hypothetical protein
MSGRYEVRFAPAPPDAARLLTLTIERFVDPFPGRTVVIDGPWTFEIDLARGDLDRDS